MLNNEELFMVPTSGIFSNFHDVTDKGYSHGYLTAYDRLLIGVNPTMILEVGIMEGASARMWSEVFPNATVIMIDNNSRRVEKLNSMNIPNVIAHAADAYSLDFTSWIQSLYGSSFDVILDDGSHILDDQLFVAKSYPALLKEGGVLIIEDILTSEYAHKIVQTFPNKFRASSYVIDCRANANKSPIGDDIVAVLDLRRA